MSDSLELLLSLKPAEAYNYRSWEERVAAVSAHKELSRLVAVMQEGRSLGASGIVAVMNAEIRQALEYVRGKQSWRLYPVVPNMGAFIRDQTNLGMVGAGLKRLVHLGPVDLARFGLWATRNLRGIAGRDFTVGTLLLLRAELAALRGLRPAGAYLHPQVTELALATKNGSFFRRCSEEIHRVFGFRLGLITNNPVVARRLLDEWSVPCPDLIAPFNARGYKMFPDRRRCEELFRSDLDTMVAAETTADDSLSPAAALEYLREQGVRRFVLDMREVPRFFREPTYPSQALPGAAAVDA